VTHVTRLERNFDLLTIILLLGLVGCGTSRSSDANSAGASGDIDVEGDRFPCRGGCRMDEPSVRPPPGPECPQIEPEVGDPCAIRNLLCGYGESPTVQCRHIYECGDQWGVPATRAGVECSIPPAGFCPAVAADGAECVVGSNPETPCAYTDELLCYCITSTATIPTSGSRGSWQCFGPPADTRCPKRLPNIGEACSVRALTCYYAPSGCLAGRYSAVFCFDGAWEEGAGQSCLL
jgi:hypothetical protein